MIDRTDFSDVDTVFAHDRRADAGQSSSVTEFGGALEGAVNEDCRKVGEIQLIAHVDCLSVAQTRLLAR